MEVEVWNGYEQRVHSSIDARQSYIPHLQSLPLHLKQFCQPFWILVPASTTSQSRTHWKRHDITEFCVGGVKLGLEIEHVENGRHSKPSSAIITKAVMVEMFKTEPIQINNHKPIKKTKNR